MNATLIDILKRIRINKIQINKLVKFAMTFVIIASTVSTVILMTFVNPKPSYAATTQWQTSVSYTPPIGDLNGISCASATLCEAVGDNDNGFGVVLGTTNGGTTWTSQTVLSGVGSLSGISCVSATTCEAVGDYYTGSVYVGVVLDTTNGGTTWTSQTVPSGVTGLNGISCASATLCEAVGENVNGLGAIIGTTNGGTTWTSQTVPSGVGSLNGISCASATLCEAVGDNANGPGVVLGTTNGGATWTSQTLPWEFSGLNGISCVSTTTCEAVGDDNIGPSPAGAIIGTTNGGATWSLPSEPSGVSGLNAISCVSTTTCEAVGDDNIGPSPAGAIVGTTDGGTTWSLQTVPLGVNRLNAISCVSTTTCEAVGEYYIGSSYAGAISGTTNGGATWSLQTVPSGVGYLNSISCVSDTTCEAGGWNNIYNDGAIIGTTDGGTTWTSQTLPTGVFQLYAISCVSTTTCEAVGASTTDSVAAIVGTTDGGTTWTSQTLPSGVGGLNAISCVSTTTCEAAGWKPNAGVIIGTTDGGTTWTSQTVPSTVSYLNSISCVSATTCEAVGWNSNSAGIAGVIIGTTDGGTTWTSQTLPTGVFQLDAISCVSTTTCEAVGASTTDSVAAIVGTTDGGTTWTSQTLPTGVADLFGISCLSAGCYAAGNGSGLIGGLILTDVPSMPSVSSISPNFGPILGGTTVTITGNNFSSTSNVYFGSIPATSFTVVSNTEITAVSPAATTPSTVDITVAVGGFSSPTTVNDRFTYGQQTYVPIAPVRICDTRAQNPPSEAVNQCNDGSASTGTLTPGQIININVTGAVSSSITVPSDATSVVLNVTATNATTNGGYLTIFPTGSILPNSSNLNFNLGDTVANLVQVGVGNNGQVSIYNYNGSTDVIADLQGYFIPTSVTSTLGQYVPIAPVRICDTRTQNPPSVAVNQCNDGSASTGTLTPGQTITLNASGTGPGGTLDNIPSNATAVVLNVTATNTTTNGGYLTIFPTGSTLPNASNLNFNSADTVENRVIVPMGSNGDINLFNYNGNTDVIIDVNGYYQGNSSSTPGSFFSPIVPTRICDTRTQNPPSVAVNQCNDGSASTGTLTPGQTITLNVSGTGPGGTLDNVPSNATAVVLNVTVTNTTSNGGFLTAYPNGVTLTNTSDINWSSGQTKANLVVVKIGTNDAVNIYNAVSSTDVIVDVLGYYESIPV